jgi:hypothetical protein
MNEENLRAVIHFLYLEGETNINIHSRITRVWGPDRITLSCVQKWTKRFREGEDCYLDKPRSGRPKIPDLSIRVQQLIEDQPWLSIKKIATYLGHSHNTISEVISEDLDFVRVNLKWVPHWLTDCQKSKRIEVSKILLEKL